MPDDEQRTRDGRSASAGHGGDDGDDLESLAGGLSAQDAPEAAADVDDELNLGALARSGGRSSAVASDGDARLRASHSVVPPPGASTPPPPATSIGSVSPVPASPSVAEQDFAAPRRSAGWVTPMLVGLGLGVGIAGTLFGLSVSSSSSSTRSASPSLESPGHSEASPSSLASSSAPTAAPAAQPPPEVSGGAAPLAPDKAASATPIDRTNVRSPGAAVKRSPAIEAPAPSVESPQAPADSEGPVLSLRPAAEPEGDEAEGDEAKDVPPQTGAKTGNSMDDLLDQALAPAARRAELERKQAAALEQEDLPEAPRRDDVTKAMSVLLPAIHGCAMGQKGLATAGIVVRSDGRVAGVQVSGAPFAGTASGRCMEGVIRRAQFPRFKQPTFRIKFPFAIQ